MPSQQTQIWQEKLQEFAVNYGVQIVGAVIIILVGLLLARYIGGWAGEFLKKKKLEPPLVSLLVKLIRIIVLGLTAVVAMSKFGVDVLPLIAGVSVIGVGVSLAMQGVLSNVVAGLVIILVKPFRVGEYIELLGVHGQVDSIELFSTTLIHPDLSRVVIPNRKIVGEILHNFGQIRQVRVSVGVAYATDLEHALRVARSVLDNNPRVLKNPAPLAIVESLDESAITLVLKPWVAIADEGPAQAEVTRAVVERFRAERIDIPFPQREVRMLTQ